VLLATERFQAERRRSPRTSARIGPRSTASSSRPRWKRSAFLTTSTWIRDPIPRVGA